VVFRSVDLLDEGHREVGVGEGHRAVGGQEPLAADPVLPGAWRVERTAYAEIPLRVEYELTALGRTLREPMAACCAWSEAHITEVLANRETPDGRTR
jgi:hypothetical protein